MGKLVARVQAPKTKAPGSRIVVTGSEGFVGRHLRAALLARGCEVIGIDRPGTKAELVVDLSDPKLDYEALAGRAGKVDAVISMAATITRGSSVDMAARANLRVISESPVLLMEALAGKSSRLPHLVYCSTYKMYGPPNRDILDPEDPPQHPDPHSYGCAKFLAERLIAISSLRTGYGVTTIRPTCIYGPGQHRKNAIPTFLSAVLERRNPTLYGNGRNIRDDVFAPDLSWLLAEAALRRIPGAFHASGERSRTILETAIECCNVSEPLSIPGDFHPVCDETQNPKWWLDQRFDRRPSEAVFDYKPVSLLTGLIAEAQWLRDGGHQDDVLRYVSLDGDAEARE